MPKKRSCKIVQSRCKSVEPSPRGAVRTRRRPCFHVSAWVCGQLLKQLNQTEEVSRISRAPVYNGCHSSKFLVVVCQSDLIFFPARSALLPSVVWSFICWNKGQLGSASLQTGVLKMAYACRPFLEQCIIQHSTVRHHTGKHSGEQTPSFAAKASLHGRAAQKKKLRGPRAHRYSLTQK